MRLEWARHDWVPKWVKCTSLPYLKDILTDVRMVDVRMLGRTDVHGGPYGGFMDIWMDVFANIRMDVNTE